MREHQNAKCLSLGTPDCVHIYTFFSVTFWLKHLLKSTGWSQKSEANFPSVGQIRDNHVRDTLTQNSRSRKRQKPGCLC